VDIIAGSLVIRVHGYNATATPENWNRVRPRGGGSLMARSARSRFAREGLDERISKKILPMALYPSCTTPH